MERRKVKSKTTQRPAADTPRRQKVHSAETGLSVLKTLGAMGGAASLTALAARLQEHPSKVHRYLVSLVDSGFVYQDGASARYTLGSEAIAIGLIAQRQCDALTLAGAELPRLVEELGVTCFAAVLSNHGPTIVRWEEPMHSVVVNVRVGSVFPVLWSATGRAFGAFCEAPQIDSMIDSELSNATDAQRKLLPNRAAIDLLFKRIRAQGCSSIRDTFLKGVSGVAVPVFDVQGRVPAVMGALGVSGSLDPAPSGISARALMRCASTISSRLGYGRGDQTSRSPVL